MEDTVAPGAATPVTGEPLTIGVVREDAPGERRVALVPDQVRTLRQAGLRVAVEAGAGAGAWQTDEAYAKAGAEVVDASIMDADLLVSVGRPPDRLLTAVAPGRAVLGLLGFLGDPEYAGDLARRGVTAIGLDGLPRTLSRAQPMDALTSQASVAGYKAVLVAANAFDRYFPMMFTAAGTVRPARVLVLGAGVAGLQAIGTARRLGAVVSAYDLRPEARAEAASVGATIIELASDGDAVPADRPASGPPDPAAGGYARALAEQAQRRQREALAGHIARQDIVITTAQVPGRRPPVLVDEDTVKQLAAGSVVVDLAAGPLGGNVAGSQPGQTVRTDEGVLIIGAENLAAEVPVAASEAYSRNVAALLDHLIRDGRLAIDLTDEIQAGVVVTHAGRVVHPALAERPTEGKPHG